MHARVLYIVNRKAAHLQRGRQAADALHHELPAGERHRQVRSALAAGHPVAVRRARAEVFLGPRRSCRAGPRAVGGGLAIGARDRQRGGGGGGGREAVGVLERAAHELDEGFHPAVHDEQANVGRLVVHADTHELRAVGSGVGVVVDAVKDRGEE